MKAPRSSDEFSLRPCAGKSRTEQFSAGLVTNLNMPPGWVVWLKDS